MLKMLLDALMGSQRVAVAGEHVQVSAGEREPLHGICPHGSDGDSLPRGGVGVLQRLPNSEESELLFVFETGLTDAQDGRVAKSHLLLTQPLPFQ